MVERGLQPEFSIRVEQQLVAITGPGRETDANIQVQNRARQLIEEVMVSTNGCTARRP